MTNGAPKDAHAALKAVHDNLAHLLAFAQASEWHVGYRAGKAEAQMQHDADMNAFRANSDPAVLLRQLAGRLEANMPPKGNEAERIVHHRVIALLHEEAAKLGGCLTQDDVELR